MEHALRSVCLAVLVLAGAIVSAQDSDRYYIMKIGSERAGWMRESTTRADGLIASTAEMQMSVKRGPIQISITIETEFVETADHEPVSMRSTQTMGSLPVSVSYTFTGDSVEVTTTQNDSVSARTQDRPPGDWVTPAKAAEIMRDALRDGAGSVAVTMLDPAIGLTPITTTRTGFEPSSIEVLGKVVPGFKTTSVSSIAPASASEEFIDLEGNLLRSETTLGGLKITTIAADRALALAEIDAPEMMQSTFITPTGTIDRPRRTARGVYLLTSRDGALEDLPQTSSQTTERVNEQTVRVTVTSQRFASLGDEPSPDDLADSTMVACADEAIVALIPKSGVACNAPASVRAESHRRFVHRYIDEKSLGVGFATASEVARTRVGDCTEHAVLLAAVLRADGIPARVASGLIYADRFLGSEDIFGYHMWTRAYVDTPDGPRWVDLDATLPDGVPYDATHITLDESALSDGDAVNAMIALAPLMGRLDIEIESTE
ncbi:MAG: transglutaminase domain-containing protein [Planctomycetota bacterium]